MLVVGAIVLSIFVGTRPLSVAEVATVLVDSSARHSEIGEIVWGQRLPRTTLGICVGAAMALAGAMIQGHTRNALADPSILGVSSGAAFAVVLIVFAFDNTNIYAQVAAALVGAVVASLIVFSISALSGGLSASTTLILAGAAMTALFTALTTAMILRNRASLNQLRFWNSGALSSVEPSVLAVVAPILFVGAVIALSSAPALNALAIGPDTAQSLGINVPRSRVLGLVAVTLLAGGATCVAGPLAFLGLLAPHAIRALTGPDYRWVLPAAPLAGAGFVLLADVVGRRVIAPAELNAGIVLAAIGAPVFIALVRRRGLIEV